MDLKKIRERIDVLKEEMANYQGRIDGLDDSIREDEEKLIELLGCKPGEEKAAIRKLKEETEKTEQGIEALLDEAESLYGEA